MLTRLVQSSLTRADAGAWCNHGGMSGPLHECELVGVGLEAGGVRPVMLLREQGPVGRVLPIWIGLPEAGALEAEHRKVPAPRPTTHHLLASLVEAFGRRVDQVHITALEEGVFLAELVFDGGLTVSARPSDAVTLALHVGAPVLVAEVVLDTAGLPPEHVMTTEAAPGPDPDTEPPDEEKVEEFRRFLDDIDPEDFGKG